MHTSAAALELDFTEPSITAAKAVADTIAGQESLQRDTLLWVPERAQRFLDALPATVHTRGDRAFYDRTADSITMPPVALFSTPAYFAATLAHEAGHWTGHPDRLDRTFGKRFSDDAYAFEELCAEMTSALLGADLGLPTSHMDDHAAYIGSWLKVLRKDSRAIMTAPAALPDLGAYRRFVVAFSGGKDSLATLLHLLSLGVPAHAIELHHHDVDGHRPTFMDWPCTPAYVRAIAQHFGIALYVSWREGGFARELTRDDAPTAPIAPIAFATPTGIGRAGGNGSAGTRGSFPRRLPIFGCAGAAPL